MYNIDKLASKFIYTNYHGGIFKPEQEMPDGYKFVRILGWQEINGKKYWTFAYTLSKDWGIDNYGIIEQKVNSIMFLNIYFIN